MIIYVAPRQKKILSLHLVIAKHLSHTITRCISIFAFNANIVQKLHDNSCNQSWRFLIRHLTIIGNLQLVHSNLIIEIQISY